MAANASSNVVNLTDHERARRSISPAESGRVLSDCRDLALRRLSKSLHEMLSDVEEELFQMATATYDREMQDLYLDARGKAKDKRDSIEAAFSRHFVEFFNRKVRGELGLAVQSVTAAAQELRLVEEDDLAESIALQEIASRLREQCEDELYPLGERVAVLLDRNELGDEENPISPQAVCAALKGACDEIEGGVKLRLVLLKQLEQHVSRALHSVYADLNAELARWNILPELKRGQRRPASSPSARQAPRPDEPPASPAAPPPAGASAPDLFAALLHLIQAHDSGAAAGTAAGEAGPAPVPAGGAPSTGVQANGFFDSLTDMQRLQRYEDVASGTAVSEGLPDLGGALGTLNVLRQIKARGVAQGVGQLDAITIDIVAMLFDFIFDDDKIPDAIKALVGRLQIPVLKVAMLDKSFFSSRAHPARRLLDSISHASIGWGREVDRGDPLYKEIGRIVERVQSGFERDVQIFADLLAELEAFLAAREQQARMLAERSVQLMEKREAEEIAWLVAGQTVSRRLSSEVPDAVRLFLLDHWQCVLKELCLRHGDDHHSFLSAVATMDDLVWSVAAKANGDERKKLVGTLPLLLRSLHVGLDLIGLPQEQRNSFFDALVALHSAAVKAGLGAGAAGTPDAPGREIQAEAAARAAEQHPINPEGELFVTRITQDDVQIEEVALVGAGRSASGWDEYHGLVEQLIRGDWVEFRPEDGPARRARLSWISPKRGVFLFTSPQSPRATAISPAALAHQLRNGLVHLVEDEPLFERAVNGVLGSLQAA